MYSGWIILPVGLIMNSHERFTELLSLLCCHQPGFKQQQAAVKKLKEQRERGREKKSVKYN